MRSDRLTRRGWIVVGAALAALVAGGVGVVRATRDPWPPRLLLVPAEPLGSQPIGFAADGRSFRAAGIDGLTTWDLATGRPLGPPTPLAVMLSVDAADGASFVGVVGTPAGHDLVWVDAASGAIRARLPTAGYPTFPPRWDREGGSIRLIRVEPGVGWADVTWDLGTGAATSRPIRGTGGSNGPAAWSPDGRTLAWVDPLGAGVHLWDLATDRPAATLGPADRRFQPWSAAAFAPDGRALYVGRADGQVECWDVARRRLLRVVPLHPGDTTAMELALSPDGRTLASAGFEADARWRWGPAGWFLDVILQRRGPRFDGEVAVLDLTTGRVLARTHGSYHPRFAPDGRTIVTQEPGGSLAVRAVPGGSGPPPGG